MAFLRTRIDFINSFFAPDEVDEIWITFPDPQEKATKKEETAHRGHLPEQVQAVFKGGGMIHLKTDNRSLYLYHPGTGQIQQALHSHGIPDDLYRTDWDDEAVSIRPIMNHVFMAEGLHINYIQFQSARQQGNHRIALDDDRMKDFLHRVYEVVKLIPPEGSLPMVPLPATWVLPEQPGWWAGP